MIQNWCHKQTNKYKLGIFMGRDLDDQHTKTLIQASLIDKYADKYN